MPSWFWPSQSSSHLFCFFTFPRSIVRVTLLTNLISFAFCFRSISPSSCLYIQRYTNTLEKWVPDRTNVWQSQVIRPFQFQFIIYKKICEFFIVHNRVCCRGHHWSWIMMSRFAIQHFSNAEIDLNSFTVHSISIICRTFPLLLIPSYTFFCLFRFPCCF